MKIAFYTVFASKRKKKGGHRTLQNQQLHAQAACTHPGEREVRNKQKSFLLLTFQIFLFHSKPFWEEIVSKVTKKMQEHQDNLLKVLKLGSMHFSQCWLKKSPEVIKMLEFVVLHFWLKHRAVAQSHYCETKSQGLWLSGHNYSRTHLQKLKGRLLRIFFNRHKHAMSPVP